MRLIRRWLRLMLPLALAPALFAQFGNNAQKLRGTEICSPLSPQGHNGYALTWNDSISCWAPTAVAAPGANTFTGAQKFSGAVQFTTFTGGGSQSTIRIDNSGNATLGPPYLTTPGAWSILQRDGNGDAGGNHFIQYLLITPASSAASCSNYQIWADANYLYVCVAGSSNNTSTIKRAALSSF